MPEPASLPRWATAQTDPEADLTEPNEAKKDDGWLNAEKPAAGYFNWWMNLVYQWIVYLGNIQLELSSLNWEWLGLHAFAQEAEFQDGILVSGGNVGVGPGGLVETEGVSLGEDVTTTGDVLASGDGDIISEGGNIEATAGDVVAVAGNVVATAGNVVAGGYVFTPEAEARHGDRSIVIPGFEGVARAGAPVYSAANERWTFTTGDKVMWPVKVPIGSRFRRIFFSQSMPADPGPFGTFRLKRRTTISGADVESTIASAQFQGDGNINEWISDLINVTVASGRYFLEYEDANGASEVVYEVGIVYDRPEP